MPNISLKILSNKINVIISDLIKYFLDMGIIKDSDSYITIEEKEKLFIYLNKKNIKFNNTIVFYKQIQRTLKKNNSRQNNKEIQVEIRNKQSYSKCNNNKIFNKSYNSQFNKALPKKERITLQSTKIINNYTRIKNPITPINAKHKILDLPIKKKISYKFNNKDKLNINKKTIIHTKDFKKTYKSNKLFQKKYSYIKLSKSNNYKKDSKTDYKNHNKNQKINNLYQRKKNINVVLKTENNSQKNNKIIKDLKSNVKNNYLQQMFKKPKKVINKDIIIESNITVAVLANKMAIKASKLIKKMISIGIIASINQSIDIKTIELIAKEMGHKLIIHNKNKLEESIMNDRDTGNKTLCIRPPVVTIMGHVDHGKTSLLDYIRSTKIASKESGGITQHIGAYHIKFNNKIITFLDTPGHAAFTSMRLRGAKVTDIILLVIAVDDGVKPQTIEAIQHAKVADVPIIVVINKIDKLEKVNLEKIKNELLKFNILSEEWGGQNIFVNVSAKKGIGMENLLNSILLQAEVLELKSIVTGMAKGVVIESYIDKGSGPVSTVLVQEGTLNKKDIVICGFEYGKIRAIKDENGKLISKAGPSIPVEILGLSGMAIAGDQFIVVKNEKHAREVSLNRQYTFRANKLSNKKRLKLDNLFTEMNKNIIIQLKIILKTDVRGSLEAITESLNKMSTEQVTINIISSGVGSITETDASLAATTNAIILGFNVRTDNAAKKIVEIENLDVRYYSVIYDLIKEVKIAINGLLVPEDKQKIIGFAEVRNIFKSPKFNVIAGCMITKGIIKRNYPIRILRNNVVIYEGELESLRHFKKDVNELRSGVECGIGIKNYNDILVGDKIEVFKMIKIKK